MPDDSQFQFDLFRSGAPISWRGRSEVVSHVLVRRGGLFVYLVGHDQAVPTVELSIESTRFCSLRTI